MILYFSGTGNSLSVAKKTAVLTGDTAIHISDLMGDGTKIYDERIGIIFPVFFFDMPDPMRVFVEYTRFNPSAYIYGIATCGGSEGNAIYNLKNILLHKNCQLSYGNVLKMPCRSTIASRRNIKYKLNYLEEQEKRVQDISQDILQKRKNSDSITYKIKGSIFNIGFINKKAKKYFAVSVDTNICVECGICEQICPNNNIVLDEAGVHLGADCSYCMACVHWCPHAAIKIHGKHVQIKDQYHHPDIGLAEMYRR